MKNKAVDTYIAKSAEFARPILNKVRRLFHKACPKIEETIKWSMPCFEHKGIVAVMAAFKQHVRISFWKGQLMRDPMKLFGKMGKTDFGSLNLKDVNDLPPDDVLILYIKEAVDLNEQGVKSPAAKKSKKEKKPQKVDIPDDLMSALKKNKKALTTFQNFSPSHQREYVEWITEAKQEATRNRRLATAIEWMSERKPRNWKYMKTW